MKNKYPLMPILKDMLVNVKRKNPIVFGFLAVYTITAFFYSFLPVFLPKLILTQLTNQSENSILLVVLIAVGYFLIAGIIGYLKEYSIDVGYPVITQLRLDYIRDMFHKLVTMDYKYQEDSKFFDENEKALQATTSNDTGIEGIYHKLFELPADFLTILVFILLVGQLNILILLGLLGSVMVSLLISRSVHTYQYRKKEELNHAERRKKYYYEMTHDFAYGKDIRIYQFQDRILKNYEGEIKAYQRVFCKVKNREYMLGFIELAALLISDSLTYGILIYQAFHGMPISDFSMYLTAILSLSGVLRSTMEKVSFILNEGQYVYDFYQFMDKDMGEKGGERKQIEGDTLEIEFRNVTFRYPRSDKDVFTNLNFTIHKGEKLAIVGINGAGKSTLVKLMTGLFEPTEGDIFVNGISIKEFDRQEYFKMFSVVFQDINILAYTIAENVACCSEQIKEEKVKDCLSRVGLWDKVEGLEKGTEQMMLKIIDEKGTEFSGGENQKLAIARALYKNGNMVILDEPTAALDALAEAEIYQNFNELVADKTAVYISHRLASTKFCDKIALFDNNGLKEYGTHEELMKQKGEYYHMFIVQGQYYNTDNQASQMQPI